MVEVADGTQLRVVTSAGGEYPAGRRGLAAPAARALPGADGITAEKQEQPRDGRKRRWSKDDLNRRALLQGSAALALTRLPRPSRAQAPAATAITPRWSSRQEGRQGRLVHLGRLAGGGEDRQSLRGRSIRASPAASSAPAPSACSSASARKSAAASTRSTWSIRRTRRISSSGSATGLLAPYVPEDVAKHYPAEHKDPDGHVRDVPRLAVRHRLQHQAW